MYGKNVAHKALCNTKLTKVLRIFHCIFCTLTQKFDPVNINEQFKLARFINCVSFSKCTIFLLFQNPLLGLKSVICFTTQCSLKDRLAKTESTSQQVIKFSIRLSVLGFRRLYRFDLHFYKDFITESCIFIKSL